MVSTNLLEGPSAPVLLTPNECADILRVCRTTVYSLMRSGELESVLVGKRRRLVRADSIRSYIAELKASPVGQD